MEKKIVKHLLTATFAVIYIVIIIALLKKGYEIAVKTTTDAYKFTHDIFLPKQVDYENIKEIEVEVPKGATTSEIAEILATKKLVSSADWFRVQSILSSYDGKFKSGVYTLNTGMSDDDIMEALVAGVGEKGEEVKITIIEGDTAVQIAKKLDELEIVKESEFIQAMNNEAFPIAFLDEIVPRNTRLEGYLFPDTYFFNKNSTAREVITKMLLRFNEVYNDDLRRRASMLGLSMDNVITMASIIEKEIRVDEERALASAVIYNRLGMDMKLQMCSTVMYALGKNKDRLLDSDLEIDSPYNTYRFIGLPQGPICNPGADSIRAALYPAEVDYIYFVLKDEESGEHEFTNSFDEFTAAKARYKQRF